ncbi:hypothetical protein V8D89_003497 [Ganoderma adspersum]
MSHTAICTHLSHMPPVRVSRTRDEGGLRLKVELTEWQIITTITAVGGNAVREERRWLQCGGVFDETRMGRRRLSGVLVAELNSRGSGRGPSPAANRLQIGDLPSDILLIVLSSLHGQDIARCIRVCRRFAGLIHFDLRLQYKIELAQSGMVDGDSSTLPTSERRRRLLQYSSKFRNGVFDRGEDPTEYPDHMLSETHDLRVSSRRISYHESSFPVFHLEFDRPAGHFLSVFTHGSAQAGIQPRRWLVPLGTPEDPHLGTKWAVDDAQDLLVIAGVAIPLAGGLESVIEIKFFSLDSSKTTLTAHPAASRPCIQVRPDRASEVVEPMVLQLAISAQYAMWVFSNPQGEVANYSVEVYNWMTGQVISRIDVGSWPVHVIPLDHPYLLVLPDVKPYPDFRIYTFATSAPRSHICMLQLPDLDPTQHILWHHICTSRRPPPSEGSFRANPAHWMIAFALRSNLGRQRFTTYLLIPRATLSAQIRAAEARDVVSELSVPWQDWGSRGCLRLRLRRTPFRCILRLVPFGSRMPFVAFEPSSFQSGSVYVFDLNPLAARRERQAVLSSHWQCGGLGSECRTTAVVEDVEEALPGVVDPECSAIPYVVYRFDLADVLGITAVVMGMTGFMVLSYETETDKALQTWTA